MYQKSEGSGTSSTPSLVNINFMCYAAKVTAAHPVIVPSKDNGLHSDSISKVSSFPPKKSIWPESLSVSNSKHATVSH